MDILLQRAKEVELARRTRRKGREISPGQTMTSSASRRSRKLLQSRKRRPRMLTRTTVRLKFRGLKRPKLIRRQIRIPRLESRRSLRHEGRSLATASKNYFNKKKEYLQSQQIENNNNAFWIRGWRSSINLTKINRRTLYARFQALIRNNLLTLKVAWVNPTSHHNVEGSLYF